jgi:biopolymer transport protein ExbD
MARRRRESKLRVVTDVQLTSFMDMSFLLLIVFLLTAPILEYGTDVSPPQMNAKPVDADNSVVVTLTSKGKIVFQKEEITLTTLRAKLKIFSARPDLLVLIRADQKRSYGDVVEVMKAVREAGIGNVSLVTEAEDVK